MIPRLAAQGSSFQGAFLYYFHDKRAKTKARVAWTETLNLMTDCAVKAWKVMAYTAMSAERLKEAAGKKLSGAKLKKPVLAYSLSWHPDENPTKEAMLAAAKQSLAALGLQEHEVMMVAHQDEPHPHIHIIANTVHPLTGMVAELKHTKRKLSAWAREWEHKHGKVYCMRREENHQKRLQGQTTKYFDPVIADAWSTSHCGESFKDSLKSNGYDLAQGRKRFVVVDPYGKTINPVRHLDGIRAKQFNDRLEDIILEDLPTPEIIIAQRKRVTLEAPATSEPEVVTREERFSKIRDEQAYRHLQEWGDTSSEHWTAIEDNRKTLTEFYRLNELKAAMARLQRRLGHTTFLTKIVRRVFGFDQDLEDEIRIAKANYESAQQRFEEVMATMTKNKGRALEDLKAQQSKERKALEDRFGCQPLADPTAPEKPAPEDPHAPSVRSKDNTAPRPG